MRFLLIIMALLGSSTLALAHDNPKVTHLVFANGSLHAHCEWAKGPITREESNLKIQWMNGETHEPTALPGTFTVVLYMPAMHHGSAPTQIEHILNEQGEAVLGAYDVSNIYFTMAGEWDVRVAVKYPDGTSEMQVIKIQL